jgi:hypothetical protein
MTLKFTCWRWEFVCIPSSFEVATKMSRENITARSFALLVVAVLSFGLFVRGSMSIWEHKFGLGIALLSGAFLLSLFYGKHKIVILYLGVALLMLSAGTSAIVGQNRKASLLALVLLGSVFAILSRRIAQKPATDSIADGIDNRS